MIQYLGTAIYKCSAESFSKKYKKTQEKHQCEIALLQNTSRRI